MEAVRMSFAALSPSLVFPDGLSWIRASEKSFTSYCRLKCYDQRNSRCNGSHTNVAWLVPGVGAVFRWVSGFFKVVFPSFGSALPLKFITVFMVTLIPVPRVQLAEGKEIINKDRHLFHKPPPGYGTRLLIPLAGAPPFDFMCCKGAWEMKSR